MIEKALVRRVKALGGIAEKVAALGARGYFDRVIVLPGGRIVFCELKRPKKFAITEHQRRRHEQYRALGAEVAVVKTLEDIDRLLDARAP